MAQRWKPGAVVAAELADGRTYYARLLEFPFVAFYEGSDTGAAAEAAAVVTRPVHIVLAVHRDLLREGWQVIGQVPLDAAAPQPPELQFVQSPLDPADLQIIDREGDMRPATYDEVVGLPSAAVWEPEHVADLLLAHAAGRVDEWSESLRLINPAE